MLKLGEESQMISGEALDTQTREHTPRTSSQSSETPSVSPGSLQPKLHLRMTNVEIETFSSEESQE